MSCLLQAKPSYLHLDSILLPYEVMKGLFVYVGLQAQLEDLNYLLHVSS